MKPLAVGGTWMKVVAFGIGSSVIETELENIASAPINRNVIRARTFSSLPDVEEQLRDASCSGRWSIVILEQ